MTNHEKTEKHLEGCEHCRRQIPFDMPPEIIEACKKGKLVVFAGAGISTEGRGVFPFSFYEEIQNELGISENLDFPSLMSRYVKKTRDKRLLLNKAKSRIDYSKSFPDLYSNATSFHQELSTIHQIQEIVTTNWDDFFEVECAATPIVTDEDFAFWDQPFRKVFKIHGSINNPGSVIATEEDYRKCYKKLGQSAVGGSLRHLLATKTIVFVGYSFGDYDFNKIYQYLHKTMGDILPHAYFVTLAEKPPTTLKEFSPTLLHTDATFFMATLKQKLVEEKQILPDEIYTLIFKRLMDIRQIHFPFVGRDIRKDPSVIFCGAYQDGIIHAFEKILKNRNTGQYSHICRIESSIKSYFSLKKAFLSKKKYFDVAYIDGYLLGLFQMIPELVKKIGFPTYYVFGSPNQLLSLKDYLKENKRAKKLHKSAYRWAEKIAMKYEKGMVLQHSNFLMGVSLDDLKD